MSSRRKLFTYPDSKALPMATPRSIWPECTVMKDQFRKIANVGNMEGQRPFEQSSGSTSENTSSEYKTPFIDHKESESIFVSPRFILRMRIEQAEVPWMELRLEAKSQSNILYANLYPAYYQNLIFIEDHKDGILKVLNLANSVPINRRQDDM